MKYDDYKIEYVNIADIRVVNPRSRDSKKYADIVKSINTIGLKTPIVIAPRNDELGLKYYDLVCGEGRYNAYKSSGETMIPARIIEIEKDTALVMGLVENIARKQTPKVALLDEIKRLTQEGYSPNEIEQKLGLATNYIGQLVRLIEKGETHILKAVISGKMTLPLAIILSDLDDVGIQKKLNEEFEKGELGIGAIRYIRNILLNRKNGSVIRKTIRGKENGEAFISDCKKELEKGFAFLKKAEACEQNLAYIKGAFAKILNDDYFRNLLKEQNIGSIPCELGGFDE